MTANKFNMQSLQLSLAHRECFSKNQKGNILDDIYNLSLTNSLPTHPFQTFRQLLDTSLLNTEDGILLRRVCIEVGAMHLVLNGLGVFTHHSHVYQLLGIPTNEAGFKPKTDSELPSDQSHVYWPKGTGFGTGTTNSTWSIEHSLLRQKTEEEIVTVFLQVLSSYVNPGDRNTEVPQTDTMSIFYDLLQKSCLLPTIQSYLRNDSVLNIMQHIPVHRAVLQMVRALSLSVQLAGLLMIDANNPTKSITRLLLNMKTCVDNYASRLKVNSKRNKQLEEVGDEEGLALLIADIQETSVLVDRAAAQKSIENTLILKPLSKSIEQRYLEVMKTLQFGTTEMISQCQNGYRFVISHHFENNVRTAGDQCLPARMKRLAQEAVTLSTSLPLSYSSSVFVRCDSDRLDILKVLITGPADTPYANGCFEFDVYFPTNYPNEPMKINLETTGRQSVRFNPNLYNDGKVCLSVLNTWSGRSEENWIPQTSSLLQVLVSIQSLIFVPEPYFNEPGYAYSRGTSSGTQQSMNYNRDLYISCVIWAMINQIKQPSSSFKEIIHTHFWIKRHDICTQLENWLNELSTVTDCYQSLHEQYNLLRQELAKLPVPTGLSDLERPFSATLPK